MFKNVRELPDASLENTEESWKLVIDFPFDEQLERFPLSEATINLATHTIAAAKYPP